MRPAAGFILATNKVSSKALAFVESTGPSRSNLTAGGDFTVTATDDAGVYANAKIVSSSITTNDGGIRFFNMDQNDGVEVQHFSVDGSQTLAFGTR